MARFSGFDEYIQETMQSWHCPGAAVAVIRGDEVLYEGAFGLRDIGQQLPLTKDTRFPMASVTKSVTAMSVALLVDEGKLEWDKPVREYMPEFILDDAYATQHTTVRDMLSHRTGLARHDWAVWRQDISLAEFVKRLRHFKFAATFREKFLYTNIMYYATAYLVEKVSGTKWDRFVGERIFEPLGMGASNFVPEPVQEGQVNAVGYRVERDDEGNPIGHIPMDFGPHTEVSPGAAGALFSTLSDMTQWLRVHVNEGRAGDTQLVSPANLKQMHLPHTVIPGGGISEALFGNTIFTYGLGWDAVPYRGHTLVQHGGNVEGHSVMVGFVPGADVGVVTLTNVGMLPLRDVLLYEAIDRALDLEDRGWNERFTKVYAPMIAGEAKAKGTSAEERVEDAPPTHSLDAYTGTFQADGYPDIAVRMADDGTLQARIVGDWSTFRHYHYDVFEYHFKDLDQWWKLRYLMNDNGEIDAVSVPIEPMVDNVIYTRKEPELTDALVAAVVGEYVPPVDGLAFTVSAKEGKVYITQSGGAATEVKAYKVERDAVGFRWERLRFDFVLVDGRATKLIVKAPNMTLEAPRK